MARIYPFRALRYNPSMVRVEEVVTQPYDKITPAMQQAYYQRSLYNLVRIILGLPELFDGPTVEAVDDRFNYGETRTNCLGEIEGRVFVVTITWRGADRRIISARKANARERKTYYARHPR